MAKFVIDLTSSPEPDERLTAATRTNAPFTSYEQISSVPHTSGVASKEQARRLSNGLNTRYNVLSNYKSNSVKSQDTKVPFHREAVQHFNHWNSIPAIDDRLASLLKSRQKPQQQPKFGHSNGFFEQSKPSAHNGSRTTANPYPIAEADKFLSAKQKPVLAGAGIEILDLTWSDHEGHSTHRGQSTPDSTESESADRPAKRQRVLDVRPWPPADLLLRRDSAENMSTTFQLPLQSNKLPAPKINLVAKSSQSGTPYTPEEDSLLTELKDVKKLGWGQIHAYFPGRSLGSIQVRWSTNKKKIRNVDSKKNNRSSTPPAPKLRRRTGGPSAVNGFVSWATADSMLQNDDSDGATEELEIQHSKDISLQVDRSFQNPIRRILRQRELGVTGCKAWNRKTNSVPTELKVHVYRGYQLRRTFADAPADISCIAWSPDARQNGRKLRFAAGSICISDPRNMQYNKPYNLLLGDYATNTLYELPEHHVRRPVIDDSTSDNPNSLDSMKNTQDDRLFLTVDALQFSPCGSRLYSAGYDGMLRSYDLDGSGLCDFQAEHPTNVTHLDVSHSGHVATACAQQNDSIQVFGAATKHSTSIKLSPAFKANSQATPSALAWGTKSGFHNYLLAGYASFSSGDEQIESGDTCLWDMATGNQIEVTGAGRNVFDVAWNASSGMSLPAFAVATSAQHLGKRVHSVVQCYAPSNGRWRPVIELDCPAFDINHLTFCPHDDSLVAAGATDGCVYVWDLRFASSKQSPLHRLRHGTSLNTAMLDQGRNPELFDTGVRFLSWGATGSRLYSGSSDGVVKVWSPYRSEGNSHVEDAANLGQAIMSGAFSPDYCDLLIGEESGKLNMFSLYSGEFDQDGNDESAGPRPFKLQSAPAAKPESPFNAARNLLAFKEIEYRPMGDLPVRQAVQGPEYTGPFYRPSPKVWEKARQTHQAAEIENDRLRIVVEDDDSGAEESITVKKEKAHRNLINAMDTLQQLSIRDSEYEHLSPLAVAHQAAFRERERTDTNVAADRSRMPNQVGAHTPASHRASDDRIPGALFAWHGQSVNLRDLDCNGMYAHGLAPKCTICMSADAMSTRANLVRRNRCQARLIGIKANLSSTCGNCARPIAATASSSTSTIQRPGKEMAGDDSLCAKCRFECLRCGSEARFHGDCTRVGCAQCGLNWEVGVLGYDLMDNRSSDKPKRVKTDATREARNESDGLMSLDVGAHGEVIDTESLCDDEMVHYHSQWS